MRTVALHTCFLAAPFVVAVACDSTVSAVMAPDAAVPNEAGVPTTDSAVTDLDSGSLVDVATDAVGLTQCPFGAEARALIAEAIARGFGDAKYVSSESHPAAGSFNGRIAFGYSLIGTTNTLLGGFTPLQPCNASNAQWFDAYCDPVEAYSPGEFGEKFGRCSRSACEASGNFLVESYFTLRPQVASTPRHGISYAFEAMTGSPLAGRTGTVSWAENPFQLWTRVPGVDGSLAITADSTRSISVALDGGPTIDLSATTHTAVTKKANEETERLLFEATFTKVTSAGAIVASVETTDPMEQVVTGTLKLGNDLLATASVAATDASTSDNLPTLTWQGVCK